MRMRPGTLVTWLDGTTRAYGWISEVVDEGSFVILASGLLRIVPSQQLRPSRADRYLPVGMRIRLQGEEGFGAVVGQHSSYDMLADTVRYAYEVLRDTPLPLDDQQRAEARSVGGRVTDPTLYISGGDTSPYTRGRTAPVMARQTLVVGQEVLLRHPSAGLPLGMRGVLTDIRGTDPRYGVLLSTCTVRWITQPRNIVTYNRPVSSSISSVFLVRTEDASEFAQLRNTALETLYGTVKVNRRSSFKVFMQQLERKAPLNTR